MPTRPFSFSAMDLKDAEMALALVIAADEDRLWDELLAGLIRRKRGRYSARIIAHEP